MQKKDDHKELRSFRTGPLTILQLMAVLAILGVLGAWVLHRFFG
jgi:hypothetical protein